MEEVSNSKSKSKSESVMMEVYRRDRRKLLEFIISSSNLIKQVCTPSGPTHTLSDINLDTLSAGYVLSCIHSGGVLDVSEATKTYYNELAYPTMIHAPSGSTYFMHSSSNTSGSPPKRQPPPTRVTKGTSVAQQSSTLTDYNDTSKNVNGNAKSSKSVKDPGAPVLGLPHLQTEAMDICIRQKLIRCTSRTLNGQVDALQIVLGLLNSISRTDFQNEKTYIYWKNKQANILEELCCPDRLTAEYATIKHSVGMIRNAREWDTMSPSERAEILISVRDTASRAHQKPGSGYHFKVRLYEKLLSSIFDILDEEQILLEADGILKLIKFTWSTLGVTQIIHDALYSWVLFKQKPSKFKRLLTFAMTTAVLELNKHGQLCKSDHSIKNASRRLKVYVKGSAQNAYTRVLDCLDLKSSLDATNSLALLAKAVNSIAETELTVFCPVLHNWCAKAGMISATLLHQLFGEKLTPFLQGVSSLSQDAREVLAAAHKQPIPTIGALDLVFVEEIGEVSGPLILDWVISQHEYILDWIGRAFELEEWEPLSSQQKHAVSVVEVFRMIEETIDQFFGLKLPVNITHLQALLSVVIHSLDAYLTKMVTQLVENIHLYPPTPSLTRYEESLAPVSKKKANEVKILDENTTDCLRKLTISKLCIRLNTLQYLKNQISELEDGMRKSWGLVQPSIKRKWLSNFNLILLVYIAAEECVLLLLKRDLSLSMYSTVNIVEEASEVLERTMSMSEESVDELFATTFDGIRNNVAYAVTKISNFIGTLVSEDGSFVGGEAVSEDGGFGSVRRVMQWRAEHELVVWAAVGLAVVSRVQSIGVGGLFSGEWWKANWRQRRVVRDAEEGEDGLVAHWYSCGGGSGGCYGGWKKKKKKGSGTKAVFWDLREGFLFRLYRGGVEKSRMDAVLPNVDSVLNQICRSIDEVIRDSVVLSIFHTLVEGYIWVLLDGGPSRAFSDMDITLMEEDLGSLKKVAIATMDNGKCNGGIGVDGVNIGVSGGNQHEARRRDFFVADGEGLPRSTVERESKFAHQILSLFCLQTSTIIQMLMAASENIATTPQLHIDGHRSLDDVDTYIRVLCHKKDREASKFLKKHYQLPPSSGDPCFVHNVLWKVYYEENPTNELFSSSAIISDLLKRSASFRFPESGQSSFKSLKKKFQDAW
ncbi:hypothetical protein KSS87_016274 [Heliosperma pusillum]|nr:hypothetical protein KSS87_016274 [Heliosperma pusillum]